MTSNDATLLRVSRTSWVAQRGRVKLWILCPRKQHSLPKHRANNHISQHMDRNKGALNGCIALVSIIPAIFSGGLKITDAHFATVQV